MQNLCKQCIFRKGKPGTQAFSEHLSNAEKKTYSVLFQSISQLQYWAKRNRPVICFYLSALCSPEAACSLLQMDQRTTIDLSPCLHFHPLAHLSIHLFIRVLQRAMFSSEKRLKEQKKRKKRAGCLEQSRALFLWHKSSLSDPWNTTEPAPCTLGPCSK